MKKLLLVTILFGVLSAISFPSFAFQTIYIVRHGEKVDESRDPELSTLGQQRAERLAFHLRDAQVARIYVTEFKRTLHTAQKLATANHLTPQIIAGKDISQLVEQLQSDTSAALVVGHSNTLPAILKALGMQDVKAVEDNEYDRLVIVDLSKTSAPIFHVLRY
jgi:broad specificity phosphatase PhoE